MLRPLLDRIVIKKKKIEEKTSGGIILPDITKEAEEQKQLEGIVVAVGKGCPQPNGALLPLTVKPGDRVVFSKYAGSDVVYKEEKLVILHEEDILGILENK